MANKIVVVFLICLVLGEISNVRARIFHKKPRTNHRERLLCENHVPKVYHPPTTEKFRACFHNCQKHCPREDEELYFQCELRCDQKCVSEANHSEDPKGKQELVLEEKVPSVPKKHVPKTISHHTAHKSCHAKCDKECANDDAKCLKKCDKKCSEFERRNSNKA